MWGLMKLSKLYSNRPNQFEPVLFQPGLNVVLGQIRLPKRKEKDTHNLGKTTLGRIIDFCLLSPRDPNFFLFKHKDLFGEFVFFLEIELSDGSFLTIRRSVEDATKISFKKHTDCRQAFADLPEDRWDHQRVPFDRAKDLLDALLDLRALRPWSYRQSLGYLIRSQDDFADVFQLANHKGPHSRWKPYLAHILGFDSSLSKSLYAKEDDLKTKEQQVQIIKREVPDLLDDPGKIDGILLLKRTENEKKQRELDAFDFRDQDKETTQRLVDGIDARIAALNEERYYNKQNEKKVLAALAEDKILFDPDDAERLFREAGVAFGGQIKKDFVQLIAFNRSITVERSAYLEDERRELEEELRRINEELHELGQRRSSALAFLSSTDSFEKYKRLSDEVVTLRADITILERQREQQKRLRALQQEIRALHDEKDQLMLLVEEDVSKNQAPDSKGRFSEIRLFFNEIMKEVIDRRALLNVAVNKNGHLDIKAEILDETGNATSADMGHTYRKLLCMAFDMAVVRTHLGEKFPMFLFHDGALESLDDRKKHNLISVIRRFTEPGLQHIITVIDSDLPVPETPNQPVFEPSEIVLHLHDEGDIGRLFKMKSW